MSITSVADLYQQYLGRQADAGGLSYWQNQFGDSVDSNELAQFMNVARAENPLLPSFTDYNGQQVMTGPAVNAQLQDSAAQYNALTGGNQSAMDYDKLINPTTYGARWDVPAPAAAQPVTAPIGPAGAASAYQQSAITAPNFESGGYGRYNQNPYLPQMADEIGRRTQQGLGEAFSGIRANAVGVGGLGGSRQGVAEGVAAGRAMDSMQGQLAGLYGGDYQQAMGRGLQRYQADQGFNLGQGNLGLGYFGAQNQYDLGLGNQALTGRGQDMNFYGQQRGQDLQQLGLGATIYDAGVRGGWAPLTTAGGLFNTTAGNNVTQTSGSNAGGGWSGAAGGLLAGGSLAQQAGWWNPWK